MTWNVRWKGAKKIDTNKLLASAKLLYLSHILCCVCWKDLFGLYHNVVGYQDSTESPTGVAAFLRW